MHSERVTSSVITPPALRMMCASPCRRPSISKMSIRESMQATTASLRRGCTGRCSSAKAAAYVALLRNSSSALGTHSPPGALMLRT